MEKGLDVARFDAGIIEARTTRQHHTVEQTFQPTVNVRVSMELSPLSLRGCAYARLSKGTFMVEKV